GLSRTGSGELRLSPAGGTGTYLVLVRGCVDAATGESVDTSWWRVNWDGGGPQGTSIQVRAQSGAWTKVNDPGGRTRWTKPECQSPLALLTALRPNGTPADPAPGVVNDGMLRVEVQLSSQAADRSPQLKHLDIAFKCTSLL